MTPKKYGGYLAAIATAALALSTVNASAQTTAPHRVTTHPGHSRQLHGLGARLDAHPFAHHPRALPLITRSSVPASFSLSQYDSGPGDQGQVGSCVSWAIDYSAYDIVEAEQGISGGPQAPMYTYAQIAQGYDNGSTPDDTFSILTSQGVDDQADYWQGNYDYTTQPDSQEVANAANWRLSGYTPLNTGSAIKAGVEQAISSGMPVAISIEVHQSFEDITASGAASYTYMPGSGYSDPVLGGHEVTIIGYNSQGATIENSWGSSWGNAGYINVPWKYLSQQVEEANAIGKLVQ
jgi:C1A family cysteine protease